MLSLYDARSNLVMQTSHIGKIEAYLHCGPNFIKEKLNEGRFVNPHDGRMYRLENKADYSKEMERVIKYLTSSYWNYKTITDLPLKVLKELLMENDIKAKITKDGRTYLVEANG